MHGSGGPRAAWVGFGGASGPHPPPLTLPVAQDSSSAVSREDVKTQKSRTPWARGPGAASAELEETWWA